MGMQEKLAGKNNALGDEMLDGVAGGTGLFADESKEISKEINDLVYRSADNARTKVKDTLFRADTDKPVVSDLVSRNNGKLGDFPEMSIVKGAGNGSVTC